MSSQEQSKSSPKTQEQLRKAKTRRLCAIGAAASTLWFLVFSAGILLDSKEDRIALGWRSDEAKADSALLVLSKLIVKNSGTNSVTEADQNEKAITQLELLREAVKSGDSVSKDEKVSETSRVDEQSKASRFLWASLLFIPTNVALLTLLSALIGGCASNSVDTDLLRASERIATADGRLEHALHIRQRIAYLEESPAFSMMRGLVIYLIFISGLYIAAADPFSSDQQSSNLAQYLRLAGLLSLLGFMVGYDPTRFSHWVDMIPNPAQKKNPDNDPPPQKN